MTAIDRARALLDEIPILWSTPNFGQTSTTPGDDTGRSGAAESRVLINAAMLDLQNGVDLWCWCKLVIDEQDDLDQLDLNGTPDARTATVRDLCWWLTDQLEWIIEQHPFFPDDLTRIYWAYRHAAGQPPERTYRCDGTVS